MLLFTILIFLASCSQEENEYIAPYDEANAVIYQTEENADNIDLYSLDVRMFSEELNMPVIDAFFERIPQYPTLCRLADFEIRERYADFTIYEAPVVNERRVSLRLRYNNNKNETGFDVRVSIGFNESQLESQNAMSRASTMFTIPPPFVFASQTGIGDFAIGGTSRIRFIRGNVFVDVMRRNMDDASIDVIPIAREIDEQILNIISSSGGCV